MRLKPPFDPDNIIKMELVMTPFVVFYFTIWADSTEGPVVAIPVSLFNGLVAPKLLEVMQQFPLTTTGISTVISPNISLEEAFQAASLLLETELSNPETGRASLVWCDIADAHEQHRRTNQPNNTFNWERLQWEEAKRQVLGLQPIEYISAALLLVPHLLLTLRAPVQGAITGLLDPILQNMYLMAGTSVSEK